MKLDPIKLPENAALPPNMSEDQFLACLNIWRLEAWEYGLFSQEGAHLMCGTATEVFLVFMIDVVDDEIIMGIDPEQIKYIFDLSKPKDRAEYPVDVGEYTDAHVVAVVGNVAVDWTARQFDPSAPCPLLFTVPTEPKPAP